MAQATLFPSTLFSNDYIQRGTCLELVTATSRLIYIINSGFVFVVCPLRTIFGKKIKVQVQIESEKHGNRETRLNIVCTQ